MAMPRNTRTLRVLFSEGSSLTAREFLNVLGPAGHHIEIAAANPYCICRFSRWTQKLHLVPPPGQDPLGYLAAINSIHDKFDVILPTHEQAWLFAVAGNLLGPGAKLAIASASAFSRVESKIEFARTLKQLGLPQPPWGLVSSANDLRRWRPPFYLKAPFSTAGTGVRLVTDPRDAGAACKDLLAAGHGGVLMVQEAAEGDYAQVQALFDHGRLIAAHTSAQTAVGIGPSAAGRESVDHAFARRDVAALGEHLKWHGGLTLDYLFRGNQYAYIECNPRTVEPANAAASGVDLPGLQLRLSLGEHPEPVPPGRTGVRTHGSLAILLGTASYRGTRTAILEDALRLARKRAPYQKSLECISPVHSDRLSIVPLLMVAGLALLSPKSAVRSAKAAVKAYSVTPDAVGQLMKAMAAPKETRP